jgi:hypothetical protein
MLSEPEGDARGPLIVMVNDWFNEDHLGPSRLWVELSRKWAGHGLRTLRFDFNDLGESPWVPGRDRRPIYDEGRLEDVYEAIAALNLADDADTMLVGYCSGAPPALDVALRLHSRGVCVINPQFGAQLLRNAVRMEMSPRGFSRSIVQRLRTILVRYPWMSKSVAQAVRMVTPSAYSLRLRSQLVANGTEMLMLLSSEGLVPFPRVPIIRSFDRRRMVSSPHCRVEVVPGLDHNMSSDEGRGRIVAILGDFVLEKFAGATPSSDVGSSSKEN